MPVVGQDWLNPAEWSPVSVSWGVARDKELLRFARLVRGGAAEIFEVTLPEWERGCALRSRLESDRKSGARLAAGLPPSRVMLRTLTSPLNNSRKSAEIWPSLLDAALPFPLEQCMVAFGESRALDRGGLGCLAAAIRLEDLAAECREWEALGLDPECMVPDALIVARFTPGTHVWLGTGRAVFVHWSAEGFAACGGAQDSSRNGKALTRFLGALPGAPKPVWTGPCGDDCEDRLERGLAESGLGLLEHAMNLRAGPMAHSSLFRTAARLRRRYLILAAAMLGLSALLPFTLRQTLSRHFQKAQHRMAAEYLSVTGMRSPPGQERLLMSRWLENEWGTVRETAERVFASGVRAEAGQILSLADTAGIVLGEWAQDAESLRVRFSGNSLQAERVEEALSRSGWRGTLTGSEAAGWLFEGGREA